MDFILSRGLIYAYALEAGTIVFSHMRILHVLKTIDYAKITTPLILRISVDVVYMFSLTWFHRKTVKFEGPSFI